MATRLKHNQDWAVLFLALRSQCCPLAATGWERECMELTHAVFTAQEWKRHIPSAHLLIGKNPVTWTTLMTREARKHGLNRSSPFRPVKQREIGRLWGGPWDLGQETQPGFSQDWEQSTNAFELWCWRRLLRVPWSARRSNMSIVKGINPEYSLEGLVLKLKHQYLTT